jgi:hypothetical protein
LLRPWLAYRVQIPVGPLFCVIDGRTRGEALTRGTSRRYVASPRGPGIPLDYRVLTVMGRMPDTFARPVGRPRLTPRAPSQSSSPKASPSTTTPALRNHSGSRRRTGASSDFPTARDGGASKRAGRAARRRSSWRVAPGLRYAQPRCHDHAVVPIGVIGGGGGCQPVTLTAPRGA